MVFILLVLRVIDFRFFECGKKKFGKKRFKRDIFFEFEDENVFLISDSMKDFRVFFRLRVFYLFKRVGWFIEIRKRSCGRYRYIYRLFEGKFVREFRRVWNFCG